MPDFPHLKLPFKVEGIIKPSSRRPNFQTSDRTKQNRGDGRKQHGEYLGTSANNLVERWNENLLYLK